MIREACINDLEGMLRLYTQLHDNPFPELTDRARAIMIRLPSFNGCDMIFYDILCS